jgi:hypothetical protein
MQTRIRFSKASIVDVSLPLCIFTLPHFLSVRIVPMAIFFCTSLPYTLLERKRRKDISCFFFLRGNIAIKKGLVHTHESSQ